jgi:hypothetical protein
MLKYTELIIENGKLKNKIKKLEKESEQMRINYRRDIEVSFQKFDDILHELKENVPRYTQVLNSVEILLKEINKKVTKEEKETKLNVY